jgi:hypothetical protein
MDSGQHRIHLKKQADVQLVILVEKGDAPRLSPKQSGQKPAFTMPIKIFMPSTKRFAR